MPYLTRYFAALLNEVLQLTKPQAIFAGLFFVLTLVYKHWFGGGVSWRDTESILLPVLWLLCVGGCFYTIKAAVHLREQDIATWRNYTPVIIGDFRERRRPSAWQGIITATLFVLLFISAAIVTLRTTYRQKSEPTKALPTGPTVEMEVFSGESYKPKSKVYGIPWRADLMDLWMHISNRSGVEYQDFSFSLERIAMERKQEDVYLGFYEIAQASGSLECRTQRGGNLYGLTVAPREGEPFGRPIDGTNLETTTMSVRADCVRFPNGTDLVFVVAVKNVRLVPGAKIKPAAAQIELRYKVNGIEFQKSDFVDIRDMGSTIVKRSAEELKRLRSQLSPGKVSDITKWGKGRLMIMDSNPP